MKMIDKKSKYRSIRILGDVFFTILTIVVLIGAFFGSLYYREISAMDFVKTSSIVDYFCDAEKTISFWGCFSYSLIKNTILMIIIFVSGACIIGHPLCIVVLLYKGLNIGTALSITYSDSDVENFFVPFLHILIDAVVSTFALVLSAKEGIKLSNELLKLVISNKLEDDLNKNIKLYLLKFAVLFAIIILLSLIQSTLFIIIG